MAKSNIHTVVLANGTKATRTSMAALVIGGGW